MLRRLDSGEYLDVHESSNPFKTLKISVGDVDADGIDEAVTVAGMVADVGEDCQLHKQLYKNTAIEPFILFFLFCFLLSKNSLLFYHLKNVDGVLLRSR